jgi:RNA polymerase sigma-70 factor (ECF subfamily)
MTLASPLIALRSLAPPVDRVRAAVDAHYDGVWRFLRRMGVADRDAEDATQQVLLVFSQRLSTVKAGAERSFLFGTALRVAADYRKARSRQRAVLVEDAGASDGEHPAPGALHALVERELLACVDQVLGAMPAELREVFVLADLEELTMAEVARVLSIPPGTVASRLRRARAVFQENALALRASFERGSLP